MSFNVEQLTRREFLNLAGKAVLKASTWRLFPKLGLEPETSEGKERQPQRFLYGFAKEPIPARLSPSCNGEVIKYFGTYKPGALLRCQSVGSKEGILWGRIIHDQRWTSCSHRAIGHEEIYLPLHLLDFLMPEDLAPIHPEVPPEEKLIDIKLDEQRLIAFEGAKPVLETLVSTGIPRYPTQKGRHRIFAVRLARRMAGVDIKEGKKIPWDLTGVVCVMYFWGGQAMHGTYWHENFGNPMSHGCVNLPREEALWLFRWINPQMENPLSQDELRLEFLSEAWKEATALVIH